MASITEKIESLQEQATANHNALVQLRAELDTAADAGDHQEVATIQAEINARGSMVASYDRRLEKARSELSDAGRAKSKAANLKRVEAVRTELAAAAVIAADIDKTLALLVSQLEAIHKHGAAAREEAAELVFQLPTAHRERQYWVLDAVAFNDSLLGALLEGELQRLGVFRKVAPNMTAILHRHDLGAVGENIAKRAENLPGAVSGLADKINREL